MESLTTEDISQAQAQQRAGRAGRIGPGFCFRLYTEDAFSRLDETTSPEVLRVNLAQVVLQLRGIGVRDPCEFEFLTPPPRESLVRAMKLLYALGALEAVSSGGDDGSGNDNKNHNLELTEYGRKLAKLPLDPVFGHLLLRSRDFGCVSEMLTAVAMLSAENLFYRPGGGGGGGGGETGNAVASKAAAAHRRFASHEGDLPTFLNVYDAWRNEAAYVPPSAGGKKAQHKKLKQMQQQRAGSGSGVLLLHGDWCRRNYVSGRALSRAFDVRRQLQFLLERPMDRGGLDMDVSLRCGKDRIPFLKCVAAGLFLQVASRVKNIDETNHKAGIGRGRSGSVAPNRGRYKTKVGNELVSVHPTSTLFQRNPMPACVAYSELVTTSRTYIRGVTQIREEWLHEVAGNFYTATAATK